MVTLAQRLEALRAEAGQARRSSEQLIHDKPGESPARETSR